MSSILTEILILLLLFLTNGLFAMSELAIVTARPSRLQQMADEGLRGAQAALDLAAAPGRFLSTVQVGITLIGILAGAFGGAIIARELAEWLLGIPRLAPYAQSISIVIVVGSITFFSVVLGELVPKRIALTNPERIASLVARPMQILSQLARPIVRLLSLTTDFFLALLGIDKTTATAVSEEEISLLLQQSAQAGMIDEAERLMVERVFDFGDLPLHALMTPRPAVVGVDVDAPAEENMEIICGAPHTRLPAYEGDLDGVIGIVRAKDMLRECLSGRPFDPRNLLEEPLYLPGGMRAMQALGRFKETGTDMALVLDEFGGVDGIVTLIDILEALVGDIPTAAELAQPLVTQREDGSWLVDGLLSLDEFEEALGISDLPGEGHYQSIGGFMVYMLGEIPAAGDHVHFGPWRFEVMDMDGNRVDKVLIEYRPQNDPHDGRPAQN